MTDKKFSFDIDQQAIETLAKLLKEADLTEIEYEDQGRRVRLIRSQSVVVSSAAHANMIPLQSTTGVDAAVPAASKQHPGALKSPMVGTLYTAPEPGAVPFTKLGSRVNQGDTVCIIEAMKVMNPIKAHTSGVVKEIFFQDSTPVEYGDVLMIIE